VTTVRVQSTYAFVSLFVCLLGGICLGQPQHDGRAHLVDNPERADPGSFGDTFPWQEAGPLEFLALLTSRAERGDDFYTVVGRHVGWIVESDIPKLIALVGSKEPCAHVVQATANSVPFDTKSFVGQEVIFLLEGYRVGYFPPRASSANAYAEKDDILNWWHALEKQGEKRD
jgi:hypothetical protein